MNNNNAIDQNVQPHELHELREFLQGYGKPIVVGICIILVVLISMILYRKHVSTEIQQASLILTEARTAQDLDTLVARYPSSPAAPLAIMKLAKVYFDSGNYDMALNKYVELKLKFPNHQMVTAAELGRIHCLEARGQLEEAITLFTDFSSEHPSHFLTPQAILGQGRCLEQIGRYREAKVLYENFIAAYPESGWSLRARELLASVSKKLDNRSWVQGSGSNGSPPEI